MNSFLESLSTGIISGVLTSVIIYFVIFVFQNIIIPWYQAIIYRGVDISGEWNVTAGSSNQTGIFTIEQKAHKIKGTAIWIKENPKTMEQVRTFELDGQISERFVTFTLKHKDKKRLGISSYLVQVVGDGRRMEGFASGYNVTASNIMSGACNLTRKENQSSE